MKRTYNFIVGKGIFVGLVGVILGVPIICSPYNQANVFLIKAVFFQSFVFALFILFLSKKILSGESFSPMPLRIPMLLFLGIGLLSFTFSPYKYAVLEEFLRFLSFFLLCFLIVEEVTTKTRKKLIVDLLMIVTLTVCIYGIFQWSGYKLFSWVPAESAGMVSFFGNPNFLATYLVAIIPLLLVLSLGSTKRRSFLAGITLALALVCLVFTQTRSAWIGLFVSLLFLFFLILRIKIIRFDFRNLFILLMMFIVFLLTVIFNQEMIVNRISQLWNPHGSAFIRLHIWEVTFNMIKTSPIFGSGLGTFQIVFPHFRYPGFLSDVPVGDLLHAHNEYLEILAEMGIIGLGVFLWLIIRLLCSVLKFLKKGGEERLFVVGLTSGVVAVLTDSLFSASLRWTGPAFAFWLLIGLTVAMIKPSIKSIEQRQKKPRSFLTYFIVVSVALISIVAITRWHIDRYKANIYLARAHFFLEKGLRGRAILQYQKALDKNPHSLLALYLLGCLNAEKSDFNQAKRWFEKVDRLAPDFANIHEWKGHLFLQLGEISAAEDEYKISTKVKGSVYNHNVLGKFYLLQQKWDLAIREFQQACQLGAEILKSSVDSSTLTPAGDQLDQSIKERLAPGIENSRAFEKEEIRNARILLARAYYEKKEYEKSIQQVDMLKSEILSDIQRNSMAQVYTDIAWKYAEAGERFDKALSLCQKALDLGSSYPELIYDTRAWVYLKRGNLKEARKQIKNALEIAPDNEGLKRHLSLIQSAIQGELKEIDMQKIK